MQNRHLDRYAYFCELANTSQEFYIDYIGKFVHLSSRTTILEIGCGEGGNLLPFAQKGCLVTGIDICISRIKQAVEFFERKGKTATFVCGDFLRHTFQEKFDIILIHDVIEHIAPLQKKEFIAKANHLLKENGVAFWGFPAWQMPFGGHQQIGKSKMVSHIPFIHLLPGCLYKSVLKACGESPSCINELLDIKRTRTSIELFETLTEELGITVIDRRLWFINPHYKQKFHLKPRRMYHFLENTPYIRNFFCTSCFYLTR